MTDTSEESKPEEQEGPRESDGDDVADEFEEDYREFDDLEDEHLYEDWDELATDPEEVSRLGKALEGLLPDVLKRGVGGLMNEERLRSLAKQKELPGEVVGFILGQVDSTKREVLRVVSREVRMFLQNVDLGGELTKILTSVSFEIRTEVRFIPNDAAFEPEVKNKVSVRGRKGDKKTISDTEADDEGAEDAEDAEDEDGADDVDRSRSRWGFRRRSSDDSDDGEQGEEQEG